MGKGANGTAMNRQRLVICGCVLFATGLALTGCSHLSGAKHEASSLASTPEAAAPAREDHVAALDRAVNEHIAGAPANVDNAQGKFVRRKPYYFKEYALYPDGPGSFKTFISETESRTAPYLADVKLAKVRYATRLHQKKDEARSDENYLRETGVETLSYEYRNSAWALLGSFFVIDKTEENVNGEWVPLEPEVRKATSGEDAEKQGWFKRTWSRLLGRD